MDQMRRMSDADRAGFVARSPEGHAARSMSIKGQEEVSHFDLEIVILRLFQCSF